MARHQTQHNPHRCKAAGITLPEVMVSSVILVTTVATSLQLTGTSITGMGRSKLRGQVDSAIATRMEDLRSHAFEYLCATDAGCQDEHLSQELDYDDSTNKTALKNLCKTQGLGAGLLAYVNNQHSSDMQPFIVPGTLPPTTITPTAQAEGNRLNVTYVANTVPPVSVASTLVPHAQGWCP